MVQKIGREGKRGANSSRRTRLTECDCCSDNNNDDDDVDSSNNNDNNISNGGESFE